MLNRGCLVLLSSFIFSSISGVESDFFVVLLKSCQVFSSLGELSFFHTFSNVPVDESSFGVHQVKLVIKSSPGFSDCGGVREHADCSLNLSQISSGNDSWRLVVDSNL